MRIAYTGLGLLLIAGFSCSDPPKPLTARVTWSSGCTVPEMSVYAPCASETHTVLGTQGNARVEVDCSISNDWLSFRVATLAEGQSSFDESNEALSVIGQAPRAGGAELQGCADSCGIIMRGNGWAVGTPTMIGIGAGSPTCHVFVDEITSDNRVTGRIRCEGVSDDVTPPHLRYLRGAGAQTVSPDFADFRFENCHRE